MSGQIVTMNPLDLSYEQLCLEVEQFLDNRYFEYAIGKYRKTTCCGCINIEISFNHISRSVVCLAGYRDKSKSGKSEFLETSDLESVREFVLEFDYE